MLALLSWLPGVARLLSTLAGWLMARKWGTWLLFYLGTALGAWVQKLVTFAGVMLVANEFVVPELLEYVAGPLLGLPSEWQGFFRMMKLDQAISIILSATLARAASSIQFAKNPQAPNWGTTPGAGA